MGQIPGEDYEQGDACTHCFNETALSDFGIGWLNTPKYMRATFFGVHLCPPAVININGAWLLTQIFPCQWGYIDANVNIQFDMYTVIPAGESSLRAFTNEGVWKPAFIANGDGCNIGFNNVLLACVGTNHSKDGSGVITWGPGIGP